MKNNGNDNSKFVITFVGNDYSVAQRKRVGSITQRYEDRNCSARELSCNEVVIILDFQLSIPGSNYGKRSNV